MTLVQGRTECNDVCSGCSSVMCQGASLAILGSIYTKRKCCDNSAMTLAILLFSLKTMESLQIGVATYFQAIPLFSMRTVSLASLQRCRSIGLNGPLNLCFSKLQSANFTITLQDQKCSKRCMGNSIVR